MANKRPAGRASVKKTSSAAPRDMVENVHVPGYRTMVDAVKYKAMQRALVKVLPARPPGLTQAEMIGAVVRHLPRDLFPGGAKAGWWAKTVQLDQEAKGTMVRETGRPLRWHRKMRR